MIQSVVLLGTLTVAAYRDYKEKKVYICSMMLAASTGVLLHLFYRTPSLADMLAGAGLGVVILILSYVTRQGIGAGDGIVVLVTGIFLGFWQNLELFLTALFLAGFAALFLLVIKRKGRRYRLPFLPFLTVAYLIQLL